MKFRIHFKTSRLGLVLAQASRVPVLEYEHAHEREDAESDPAAPALGPRRIDVPVAGRGGRPPTEPIAHLAAQARSGSYSNTITVIVQF
jgi:hypothetical protein